jgi:hypothetical protein
VRDHANQLLEAALRERHNAKVIAWLSPASGVVLMSCAQVSERMDKATTGTKKMRWDAKVETPGASRYNKRNA